MRFTSILVFCFISTLALGQNCSGPNHSINIHDSWISCNEIQNPNPTRADSHWVLYDLGYEYAIGTSHIWNYNILGQTENGMKDIAIDYSIDGNNWTQIQILELNQASGQNDYEGKSGPDFGGVVCRYILITNLESWGGNCAGLSEVRFDISDQVLSSNLLSFEAISGIEDISLNWVFAYNERVAHFEIERSNEDSNNFSSIANVDSNDKLEHIYLDDDVISQVIYYYRLKVFFHDGSFEYSNIRTGSIQDQSNFKIYPNPVSDILHLKNENENCEYVLLNTSGSEVKRGIVNSGTSNIDLSQLPASVYYLKLNTQNTESLTFRVIKIP